MSLGHLGVVWDTRMRRNQIMRLAAVEIYNEITGYWLWPFGTPDIDHVIDHSMKRVARLISKDYRAPIKVECCGFTIFRCCCKKSNPKSNVFNSIVDGMENQERDMMYNRGVTDYVDRGERNNGRYLLEDDAYEAERKLRHMEDGTYHEDEPSYYSKDGQSQQSYYSKEYSQHSTYTEEDDSYARGVAAGAPQVEYDRRSKASGYSRGEYSYGDTLTRSQQSQAGWDEASESQYG